VINKIKYIHLLAIMSLICEIRLALNDMETRVDALNKEIVELEEEVNNETNEG